MDITIQSKIHPDRKYKLIAINHGEYYEIKYAGDDPISTPIGRVYIAFILPEDLYDELCDKVRAVCKASGDVFEVVPTEPRYREVELSLHNNAVHHIRIRHKDIACDYYPHEKRYQQLVDTIMRNSIPVMLGKAYEPYTIRLHVGSGW